MCWGLLGVQVVWGLQNVNTSRIFQTLGAELSELPALWMAAPVTGLLVQPVVGYLSDHTRSPLGRRRPYMIAGAILTALSLGMMAGAATLWQAVAGLWMLTASVNIVMHPFRSLIADNLDTEQRNAGYAIQVVFIGAGAVFASALPWMLANWFGVANDGAAGALPRSLKMAFEIGAVVLLVTVAWSVFRAKDSNDPGTEFSAAADRPHAAAGEAAASPHDGPAVRSGIVWLAGGGLVAGVAALAGTPRETYLIAAIAAAFGLAQVFAALRLKGGGANAGLLDIIVDIVRMPVAMKRLAIVQFFTWFGMFAMWVYAVPAITARHFSAAGALAGDYNAGANWVGVLFALYDGVAIFVALLLSGVCARIGLRLTYGVCLAIGGGGVLSLILIEDPAILWLSSVGIGVAWAAILSIPYTIVANAAPADKVGVYMGIHNIFLVVPQLVGASALGVAMDRLFSGQASYAIVLAALSLLCAAAITLAIPRQA